MSCTQNPPIAPHPTPPATVELPDPPPVGERSPLAVRCYDVQLCRSRSATPPRPTEHRWHRVDGEIDGAFCSTENKRASGLCTPLFRPLGPICASSCPCARDSHGTLGDGACLHSATVPIYLRALCVHLAA
ncbi:unnamed protein product [Laminaria digitata]